MRRWLRALVLVGVVGEVGEERLVGLVGVVGLMVVGIEAIPFPCPLPLILLLMLLFPCPPAPTPTPTPTPAPAPAPVPENGFNREPPPFPAGNEMAWELSNGHQGMDSTGAKQITTSYTEVGWVVATKPFASIHDTSSGIGTPSIPVSWCCWWCWWCWCCCRRW